VLDAKDAIDPRKVRLCSVDAATGLKAPIVFLIGAAELVEREQDLQLPPEQREEWVRDNTRRLYMAFTRADHSLVITWVGEPPECLARLTEHLYD
jgi:superfamily I DNA/RNA helicase